MNRETLKSYQWLRMQTEQIEEQIARLRSERDRVTTHLSFTRAAGNQESRIEGLTAKILELEALYEERLKEKIGANVQIELYIKGLSERDGWIFRARYIQCKSWEAIAREGNYSVDTVKKRDGEILKSL